MKKILITLAMLLGIGGVCLGYAYHRAVEEYPFSLVEKAVKEYLGPSAVYKRIQAEKIESATDVLISIKFASQNNEGAMFANEARAVLISEWGYTTQRVPYLPESEEKRIRRLQAKQSDTFPYDRFAVQILEIAEKKFTSEELERINTGLYVKGITYPFNVPVITDYPVTMYDTLRLEGLEKKKKDDVIFADQRRIEKEREIQRSEAALKNNLDDFELFLREATADEEFDYTYHVNENSRKEKTITVFLTSKKAVTHAVLEPNVIERNVLMSKYICPPPDNDFLRNGFPPANIFGVVDTLPLGNCTLFSVAAP